MRWITIEAERALIVDRGRDVVLCDRGYPGPVTLVLKIAGFTPDPPDSLPPETVLVRAKVENGLIKVGGTYFAPDELDLVSGTHMDAARPPRSSMGGEG